VASASAAISSAKSVVSDLTYVLSSVESWTISLPSLSCDESIVESYAVDYPSVATYLWSIDDGVSVVASSSITYVESLIASYATLNSALLSVASAIYYYPSITSVESSFIYAAESDSSILTLYDSLSTASSDAYSSWYSWMSWEFC